MVSCCPQFSHSADSLMLNLCMCTLTPACPILNRSYTASGVKALACEAGSPKCGMAVPLFKIGTCLLIIWIKYIIAVVKFTFSCYEIVTKIFLHTLEALSFQKIQITEGVQMRQTVCHKFPISLAYN